MFDDPVFFLSQYFQCKQADVECIMSKVCKSHCLQESRSGRGGWVGFSYLVFIYTMYYLGFKGLLYILMNLILKQFFFSHNVF